MLIKNLKDNLLCSAAVDFREYMIEGTAFQYDFIKEHQDIFYGKEYFAISNLVFYQKHYKEGSKQNFIVDFAKMFEGLEEGENKETFAEITLELLKSLKEYDTEKNIFYIHNYNTLYMLMEGIDIPEYENEKTRKELIGQLGDEIRKIEKDFQFALDWTHYYKECEKKEDSGYWG